MAREHVEAVFGPEWVQDSLKFYKDYARGADRIVLRLREMLREYDPTLPDPHDGTAWARVEQNTGTSSDEA